MYANRDDRIRTYGHSLPKRVLYQTELHPVVVVPIAANPELPKEVTAVELFNRQIITLLMFLVKWFPMLPSILMNQMHSYDGNKYKKETHDT